jgi:hypothetical protein
MKGIVLLVIVVAVSILSALWFLSECKTYSTPYSIKCMSNMREIYIAMMGYAGDHEGNLPWAGENKMPWDHLQILVDEGYIIHPELFICKASSMKPAKVDRSKKPPFKLSADTCSYTCYNKPLKFDKSKDGIVILCCRKADMHINKKGGGYCVLYIDNSRKFINSSKLPDGVIRVK